MSVAAQVWDEAHAVKCDLAVDVLRSSGRLRLRVTGSSMLPSVWPGDTLMIDRADVNAISEGDLVLYRRNRRFFVHRVVSLNSAADSVILTRGDSMPQADPPVPCHDVMGRVSHIVRDGRLIEPQKNLGLPQRAVAHLVRRSEIAARMVTGVNSALRTSRRQKSRNSNSQIPNSNDRVVPCQS